MANKYSLEDAKYFDVPVPQKFFDSQEKYAGSMDNHPIAHHFKGDNTREFYCGMIAGLRAASSIIRSVPNKEMSDDLMTAASIFATLLAIKKQ